MKGSAKFITVLLATAALTGWVACSSSTSDTDTTVNPDVPVTQDVPVTGDVPATDVPRTDVPVTTDVPVATDTPVATDVPVDVPCVPVCTNRTCGTNGCGGTCGTCADAATVCDELLGKCVTKCDWTTFKPALTWGPVGAVATLQTPADATVVKTTCFDYTGDGNGDNGLKGLAGQVNGPLSDAVSGGSIAILFELAGVTDFTNTASFQLNGLLGKSTATPAATTGDFYVQDTSYVQDICMPMIYFTGASITAGELAAGPAQFQLSIPIQTDLVIDATLIQAKVKAKITAGGDANGYAATEGVLSGVLTKAQLDTALAKLQASCDAAPAASKPSFCSYLKVAASAESLLFDLHQNGDGTFAAKTKDLPGDAASVCLTYTLATAKVVGFVPAATP